MQQRRPPYKRLSKLRRNKMNEFISYTVGLECWLNNAIKMIKCEYSRKENGVMIHAVRDNLGRVGGGFSRNISNDEFEARPKDV